MPAGACRLIGGGHDDRELGATRPERAIHAMRPSSKPQRHAAQHRTHSHHPCRQPDPAAAAAGLPARQADRRAVRSSRPTKMRDGRGRRRRAPAGRGRHRRGQRRRVRQVDQLVAIRARAPERLRAPAGQARRQSVSARRRSGTIRRVLRRARRARGDRDHAPIRSASGRSPIPGRPSSRATSTISRPR